MKRGGVESRWQRGSTFRDLSAHRGCLVSSGRVARGRYRPETDAQSSGTHTHCDQWTAELFTSKGPFSSARPPQLTHGGDLGGEGRGGH